jgi:CheY-like chemotaxis protein
MPNRFGYEYPISDGLRTLEQLKRQQEYAPIPIVIFTTSNFQRDADRSLELGAKSFITKPIKQHEFTNVTAQFTEFCKQSSTK